MSDVETEVPDEPEASDKEVISGGVSYPNPETVEGSDDGQDELVRSMEEPPEEPEEPQASDKEIIEGGVSYPNPETVEGSQEGQDELQQSMEDE